MITLLRSVIIFHCMEPSSYFVGLDLLTLFVYFLISFSSYQIGNKFTSKS